MNWIKINTALPRSPKVLRFASLMGIDRYTALGLLFDWLAWLDSQSADGTTGLTPELVDQLFMADLSQNSVTRVTELSQKNVTPVTDLSQNFVTRVTDLSQSCHTMSQALVTIGWAFIDEKGEICASDFAKHNGENAKRRLENAERQRVAREKRMSQNFVTHVTKKCDQIREDKNIYELHPNGSITTVCGGNAAAEVDPTRGGGSSGRKVALPEKADDVLAFLASQPNCGLRGEELLACAEAFFHDFDSVGWVLRGQPVQNWHAAARSFLARWQGNLASRSAAAPSRGRITYRSETNQSYEL